MVKIYRLFISALIICLCFIANNLWAAPMVGSYTINSASPASVTNFQNFNRCVDSLRIKGVSGPVTVSVLTGTGSGIYSEKVTIPPINGASATNTITINGNYNTLTFNSTSSSSRYTLRLEGADYFTFKHLNIRAGTSSGYGWALLLTNVSGVAATNNNFIGCFVNSRSSIQAILA